LYGIINGTANYVLSRMADEGAPLADVLAQAQRIGYAEADPSLDIDGADVAHKLAILLRLAFGVEPSPGAIYTEGIRDITPVDVEFAREFGFVIKLLAIAKAEGDEVLEARVHPTMIPRAHLLADVKGATNAVYVRGEALGPMVFTGAGAGGAPTATAICADIISIVRRLAGGGSLAREPGPRRASGGARKIKPMDRIRTHYYLRFGALDRPGVLSEIAGILGRHDISISSVIQKGREEMGAVPLVMMTHDAEESNIRAALREIDRLKVVAEPSRLIRIEDRLS
ncbi:MAG: homoserine dehydrogenase, partial [Vicinamibacteria bacterium]